MKKFSKPFAELVIVWKSDDFLRARIKLTFLYLLIIAVILSLFSAILNWQIEENISVQVSKIQLSPEEITQNLRGIYPNRTINSIKLDDENGQLFYDVGFDDHSAIKVDSVSGRVIPAEEPYENFVDQFTSDIKDTLWIIDLSILLLGSFLSYFLAGKTLAPIAEKMKQQKQFVADAAHELRNPLSAIQASSESLLRAKKITAADAREVLREINEESARLIALSEDLLTLDQSKNKQAEQKIDLGEITNQILKKIEPLARTKQIHFQTDLESLKISAARKDLEKVLFNLLHNAIKFSPKKSVIVISVKKSGFWSVQDFGAGITPKDLPHIFDRFYKADNARTFVETSGSGLGLSIVKAIADSRGWKIETESKKDEGTKFRITF
ncbi:MAG: HAMP domain-containing sensor histidine kinase [Patescibacteria group bacterium]